MTNVIKQKKMFSIATDPIYIGTGGYTIGRVDNTIVRDPTTKIPKIPGSSLAGTWRYYVTLELLSEVKNDQPDFNDIKLRSESSLEEKIKEQDWKNDSNINSWKRYFGNKIAKITCAGQDNVSTATLESPDTKDKEGKTGHCGHCIVCKAFGYSKNSKSRQGMLFFSDLNILFFPVYTRLGVKCITSKRMLNDARLIDSDNIKEENENKVVFVQEKIEEGKQDGYINLGWLNLPYKVKKLNIDLSEIANAKFNFEVKDIIIVPDSLISQIINSNLEVRTSVSIDPITGAAKKGALFTSEAIPRGTIFYGEMRLFDKDFLGENNLPAFNDIWHALEDSKNYYETLGIGGMTTRGFGRMEIWFENGNSSAGAETSDSKSARGADSPNGGSSNDN